jgi:hypothetical protein
MATSVSLTVTGLSNIISFTRSRSRYVRSLPFSKSSRQPEKWQSAPLHCSAETSILRSFSETGLLEENLLNSAIGWYDLTCSRVLLLSHSQSVKWTLLASRLEVMKSFWTSHPAQSTALSTSSFAPMILSLNSSLKQTYLWSSQAACWQALSQ